MAGVDLAFRDKTFSSPSSPSSSSYFPHSQLPRNNSSAAGAKSGVGDDDDKKLILDRFRLSTPGSLLLSICEGALKQRIERKARAY